MQIFLVGLDEGLDIYCWIMVAFSILHLLRGFGVIDVRNRLAKGINTSLDKVTAPALWPIRRLLPDLGAVDISPIVLISIMIAFRYAIALYVWPRFV
jgi:YggT family protein